MFTTFIVRLVARIEARPVMSFFIVLITLFSVIALSHVLRTPEKAMAPPEKTVKSSRLFVVGTDGGHLTTIAKVKKSTTVDIVALAPGIVKTVAVHPGQSVTSGQIVATLTTDYASGTTALSQERAGLQADLTERTYALEKEINELERKIAKSDDTQSDRKEKVALDQLKIELEQLKVGRETARIDLALALRSDAALRPKTLTRGTIEHIAVREGDIVSTGTVLMTLRTTAGSSMLEAAFPKKIADALLTAGIAEFIDGDSSYTLAQGYRAKTETSAGLVMVTYPLPDTLADTLAQHDYVTLSVPLAPQTGAGFLIPIDAIRSASGENSVLLMDGNHVTQSRTVTLGETAGASVTVKSGLIAGDEVVLDASVLPGEAIEPIR